MKFCADYHVHSRFSDGRASLLENVEAAAARGLCAVALTEHGPRHLYAGIRRRDVGAFMREAAALRAQFAGRIDVRAGIEANIIGLDGALDIPAALKDVDVVAAGYHRSALCQGLLDNALMHAGRLFAKRRAKEAITQAFVQAVRTNRLSYLVHLGQHTGPLGYEDIARACAEHNVAIEISAHKGHLCFTPQDARAMKACGAVFVVNSDAHAPRHIGRFDALSGFIAQAGLTCRDIVNARGYEGRRPRGL